MDQYVAVLFVVEALAIALANAATVIIFTRTSRLHGKEYTMIVSQAVADLMIGLFSVPMFVAFKLLPQETVAFPGAYGRLYYSVDGYLGGASLLGLAILAVERAHATYYPFRHAAISRIPYMVSIAFMWTVPVGITVPWHFYDDKSEPIFIKMSLIGPTLLVICSAYILIVIKVRCTNRVAGQAGEVSSQENKKLTMTLAVVTVLSLAMWLPYHSMALDRAINKTHPDSFVYFSSKFLMYGNSLVNSVIYAFRMREIKRELLRVFRCCRKNDISTSETSA